MSRLSRGWPKRRSPVRLMVSYLLPCVLLLFADSAVSWAQPRTLRWPRIAVDAHLDADGVLTIRERQDLRLTGDWNGGMRRFDVRAGQALEILGMERLRPDGAVVPMIADAINLVDGYSFDYLDTVKWRSRLASDPPFLDSSISYRITAQYRYVVQVGVTGQYRLNHDFLFEDREGMVDTFVVKLTLDSAWRAPAGTTMDYAGSLLPPGKGFVVSLPLERVAPGLPMAVHMPPLPTWARWTAFAALLAGVGIMLMRLWLHDRRIGRFAPVPRPDCTPAGLNALLFAHPAEIIATLWADDVTRTTVSAMLVRMERENKLSARTVPDQTPPLVALSLLVPRESLQSQERVLIDLLFDAERTETDAKRVRTRYSDNDIDPVATIRTAVEQLTNAIWPSVDPIHGNLRYPSMALLLATFVCGVAIAFVGDSFPVMSASSGESVSSILPAYIAGSAVSFFVLIGWSAYWQNDLAPSRTPLRYAAVALSVLIWMYYRLFIDTAGVSASPSGWWLLFGTLLFLSAAGLALDSARLSTTAARYAARRQLHVVRQFFERELQRETPQLDSSWYPYFVALELSSGVNKWVETFMPATRASSSSTSESSGARESSVSGVSTAEGVDGFAGFGNGGGFAGAGGGSSWGDLGAMSAFTDSSFPTRSGSSSGSSSGSGSSGSSSSSGGGGGGGW